jgi:hypothetical protein
MDTLITGGPVRRSVTSSEFLPASLSLSLLSQALKVSLAALAKQRPPGFTPTFVSDWLYRSRQTLNVGIASRSV